MIVHNILFFIFILMVSVIGKNIILALIEICAKLDCLTEQELNKVVDKVWNERYKRSNK